ncbi:apoptosis inducing factor mitochondria associated 4 isoform X2 [Lepisosteus oculatus]|uniref:apoptosis inducing factor mitochondria associated 4 isoform X2 n=1 Tax=Lepisosteus oculatus TaxID=7918 RepID=UPI00371A1533
MTGLLCFSAAISGQEPDSDQEEVTAVVCLDSDLQDGQMKEVEVGRHKVLLVRSKGEYSAIGGLCTHYGAPLWKGALSGNRVRCPWHGACFNIKTGDLEEYPGLDSLPSFKVKIEDSKVYVSATKKALEMTKRVKKMGCRMPGESHIVVLIGGGPATLLCAETLRQERYGGRIIMVTRENMLPYDKTKLSKVLSVQDQNILLRQTDFFQQYDIEVWLGKEATSVNTNKNVITFNDGSSQRYDQLLIATGCRARILHCPGADLDNVRLLQTPDDATKIHQEALGKNTVILGTSFIGMEVASCLSDRASSVTVIGSSEVPFQKTLGSEIGRLTMKMLEDKLVKFYMNESVTEVKGEGGKVKEVVLRSGKVLPADIFIVAIGVIPNSDFLKESSVKLTSKKTVIVDKFMRTNVPGVFCAGDIASFPLSLWKNEQVNIGHWQVAQAHGRIAALNMLNIPTEINSVPFFWTVLLGKSFRYAGYGEGYTEIVMKGKLEEMKFLAFYIKNDEVVAVASLNFDPAVSQVAEMMAAGRTITKTQAASDDLSWLKVA